MWTLIFLLFVVFVGGGWLIGKLVGGFLFPNRNNNPTFIDQSVHHHYTKQEHHHIHIIDEETKKQVKHYHELKKLKK